MTTEERERIQPSAPPEAEKTTRPSHVKLTAEETLQRMEAFDERREALVAAVRQDED